MSRFQYSNFHSRHHDTGGIEGIWHHKKHFSPIQDPKDHVTISCSHLKKGSNYTLFKRNTESTPLLRDQISPPNIYIYKKKIIHVSFVQLKIENIEKVRSKNEKAGHQTNLNKELVQLKMNIIISRSCHSKHTRFWSYSEHKLRFNEI